MLPVKLFSQSCNTSSAGNSPTNSGIAPWSLFRNRFNSVRFFSSAKLAGTSPESMLFDKSIDFRLFRLPREGRVQLLKLSELRRYLAGESAVAELRRDAGGVGVVIANVELAERGEVAELRRDDAGELVAGEGEVFEVAPDAVLVGDLAGEEVAAEVEVAEEGHGGDGEGEGAGHVEDLEVGEAGEVGGEGGVEDIVGEVEKAEGGEGGEGSGDGAGELVVGEGEVGEEREVGEVGGEGAGERERGEVESGHVLTRVARDAEPGAVAGGGVPRGEGVIRVVDYGGCFEREERAVLWDARCIQ
ncbi:hypothetical protein CR513_40886, partial [Mucuna pruriens]